MAHEVPIQREPVPAPPYLPTVVLTEEQLQEVAEAYSQFDAFVFDVETKGPHRGEPMRNDVFWLSLAGPGRADVIPFGHPTGDIVANDIPMRKDLSAPLKARKPIPVFGEPPKQLWPGDVFAALKPLFFGDALKIGHNVKFDVKSVAKYYDGQVPVGPYADTIMAEFLLDENLRGYRPYSLGQCVQRAFKFEYDKSIGKEVEIHPFHVAARYSYLDAKYTWLLWLKKRDQLEKVGLLDLFWMEMDVLDAVISMEYRGVDIDLPRLDDLDELLIEDIAKQYDKIKRAAGFDINLNADVQVRKLVYEVRKHKPTVFTEKTQEPATSRAALEGLAKKDPIVASIIDWQELHKLKSTFVDGLKEKQIDGRIHAEFDQRGAATGRFSSRNPNLQNIPSRSERGKKIRDVFVAPKGYSLIVADYSQIELRLLAHFCQDPLLLAAYTEGLDLHTLTAQRAYSVDVPTSEQRSRAKNVNFSMVFGAVAQTITTRYGVPLREAEKLVEAFFTTYRRVDPWRNAVVKRCKRNRISPARAEELGCDPCAPFVETILGRRRRLPEIFFSDNKQRSYAERQAVNSVIQGSAADINKLALVRLRQSFLDRDMSMVLTVHDEIVSVVADRDIDEGVLLVRTAMEDIPDLNLRVPLIADIKVCQRWSDGK